MGIRPQFKVSEGIDGGAVIVTNVTMKNQLIALLEDLTERSVTETALMHELRECGTKCPRERAHRAD